MKILANLTSCNCGTSPDCQIGVVIVGMGKMKPLNYYKCIMYKSNCVHAFIGGFSVTK
jgi:hypothetical protein